MINFGIGHELQTLPFILYLYSLVYGICGSCRSYSQSSRQSQRLGKSYL